MKILASLLFLSLVACNTKDNTIAIQEVRLPDGEQFIQTQSYNGFEFIITKGKDEIYNQYKVDSNYDLIKVRIYKEYVNSMAER